MVKTVPWIVDGVGIGFAAYVLLNTPSTQYSALNCGMAATALAHSDSY